MSEYYKVYAGDMVDYHSPLHNPNLPYARCKIVSVTEDEKGVTLRWFKDTTSSDGYRTFDPDKLENEETEYPHYREKVLRKDRTDIIIKIHRFWKPLPEDLFTL